MQLREILVTGGMHFLSLFAKRLSGLAEDFTVPVKRKSHGTVY